MSSLLDDLAVRVVQRQLDAHNAKDLETFLAQYTDDAQLFRPPNPLPFVAGKEEMRAFYRDKRFNNPALKVDLISRLAFDILVIDHERVYGMSDDPLDLVAAFRVENGLITCAWFFNVRRP